MEAEVYWAKEISTDKKYIVIWWIWNINKCNMYNNNTFKVGKGMELYMGAIFPYITVFSCYESEAYSFKLGCKW